MPDAQKTAGKGRASWRSSGRTVAIGAGVLIVLLASLFAAVESGWFREALRKRLVAELERTTESRVELREFTFSPGKLEVGLRGLTVHGRERASERPLFSAELIEAGWKITSVWNLRADLRYLRIFKPAINVAYRDDGSNNLPAGMAASPGNQSRSRNWPAEAMALRAGRLEVLRGEIRLAMHSKEMLFPLDVRAEGVQLSLDREPSSGGYAGRLDFRKATMEPASGRQLSASGRAKFSLSSQKIDIESVELRTAGSQLSLQGSVGDFQSPRLDFRYDLLLDAADAAQLLGAAWQGKVGWRGQGSYSEKEWQLDGPLSLTAVKSGIAALPSAPLNGKAQLRLAGQAQGNAKERTETWQAELKELDLSMLGGRVTGQASVGVTAAATQTQLELTADRISLPALSSSLERLPAPLVRLQWAGAISGPTKISFVGAGDSLALGLDWRIDASPVVPTGFTAVSGVLRGSYRGADKHLETEGSYLNVGPTMLAADGWFDAKDSRLAIRIDASRPEDARPLMELLWNPPAELFPALHGRVRAALLWMGGAAAPRINGNLRIADFDYRNLRWDSLSGVFDLSADESRAGSLAGNSTRSGQRAGGNAPVPENRRAELKIDSGRLERQGAAVDFQGTVGLPNGELSPQSPLSLQASLHNVNLKDLETAAQLPFPIRGKLEGTFRATGTLDNPRGEGSVTLASLEAYGESMERLGAQIELLPGRQLALHRILAQKGKGTIEGEASIGLQSREYRFSLSGANLALESLQFVRGHLPATGVVQAKLTGSGTFERPAIQAALEISKLSLGGWQNGQFTVGVDTHDGKANVKWKGNLLAGDLQGSGDVDLKNSYPFSARLEFGNVDLTSLLPGDHEAPASWKGRAAGSVTAEGNLNGPQVLAARGEIGTLAVSGGPVEFHNDQAVRFRYERGAIELQQMHLVGKNSDLEATGTLSVSRDPAIHLAVKGHADLAALTASASPADTNLALAGAVSVDAELSGTVGKPIWRGRLDFADASLHHTNFSSGLSRIKGTVRFDGNRARLENVTAESGGGTLKLGGFVTYSSATGVAAQLEADIAGMRIRYPEGVSTWFDGRLTLAGSTKASTLGGRLTIVKETANPEFDVGAALLSRAGEPLVRTKAEGLKNLRLDVQVVSATNLSLETTTAKNLRGDIDLRIQGSLEHPSLVGRISILQGEITIGGRRYLADSGDLTFSNPFRIEPVLNLHVRARVEQYDITLNFIGPLDRLTITYNSDPPLPTSEILALMVAGNAYSTTLRAASPEGLQQAGAGSLLSQALNQQTGNRLDRIFGAGHIRVDPQIAGFDRPANANIALEQHFSDNLTLLYVTNVTSAQQRIIQGEWTLSPRFSVIAVRDQNILLGVNFQIKLRFR